MSIHSISPPVWRVVEAHRGAEPPASSNNTRVFGGLRWRGLAAELLAYSAYRFADDAQAPGENELEIAAKVIRKRFGLSSGTKHRLRVTPETFNEVWREVCRLMPEAPDEVEGEDVQSADEGCPVHPNDDDA